MNNTINSNIFTSKAKGTEKHSNSSNANILYFVDIVNFIKVCWYNSFTSSESDTRSKLFDTTENKLLKKMMAKDSDT